MVCFTLLKIFFYKTLWKIEFSAHCLAIHFKKLMLTAILNVSARVHSVMVFENSWSNNLIASLVNT